MNELNMEVKTKFHTTKFQNLVLKSLKHNKALYDSVPYPDNLFAPYGLVAAIGGLGSGKSSFLVKFLKVYEQTKTFNGSVLWFSPTMAKEDKAQELPPECEIIDDFTEEIFFEKIDIIEHEIEQYKIHLKYMEIYDKALSGKPMTQSEIMILEANDYEPLKTKYKHMPTNLIVLDDLQANKTIYSANMKSRVAAFFLNVRHFNTMVIFSCQTFKNAIPRQLKSNVKIWILFACRSKKYQLDIAESMVGKVDVNTFIDIWNFCTAEKYDALVVDYSADEKMMFRKNLAEMIQY